MGLCASAETSSPSPNVDLSHFEVLRVLGRGGFGKVNAIERKTDKKVFALKAISKAMILEKEANLYMSWLERKVMSQFHSHFLVNCIHAFQDDINLYLVMPLMQGGDLRYYLRNQGGCSEEDARFYMAEIILALEEMHSLRIIYRDLKPENCLLDDDGHLRLSDFGLAAQIKSKDGKTSGYCGTTGYIAPEVIAKERYSYSADYYSLGIVMYELLHRSLPPKSSSSVPISSRLSQPCRHLLKGLLAETPNKRWGCRPGDSAWQTIKECEWFSSLNWSTAKEKKLSPPFKPNVTVANCDPIFELEEQIMNSGNEKKRVTQDQQKHFIGWEFRTIPRKGAADGEFEDDQVVLGDFTQKAMEYARGKADSRTFVDPATEGKDRKEPDVANAVDLSLEIGTEEEIRRRIHSTIKPNTIADEKDANGRKRKPTGITATKEGKEGDVSPSTDTERNTLQPTSTPKTGNESDPASPRSVGRGSESIRPSKMDMLEISTAKTDYDDTPEKSPLSPNVHEGEVRLEVPDAHGGRSSRGNSHSNRQE